MHPLLKFGSVEIPTFFLVISLSLTLLLVWFNDRLQKVDQKIFNPKIGFNLVLLVMVSGLWGGRLLHVFYEEWPYYQDYPFEIFKVWKGGFVFYGGFLVSLVCSWIYLKFEKESFLRWADFLAPLLSASYMFGRLGCFFEGCCYGKHCELPWAIAQRHPTQIYMLLAELALMLYLLWRERKPKPFTGFLFLFWIGVHTATRFLIEFLRDDDRGSLLAGLSVSQWLSVLIFTGACSVFFKKLIRK